MTTQGPVDLAALTAAYRDAVQRTRRGEAEGVASLVRAVRELTVVIVQSGHASGAREILASAREVCREGRAVSGEVWILLFLVQVCRSGDDLDAAQAYCNLAIRLLRALPTTSLLVPPLPEPAAVVALILDLTHAFYYDREDFASAAALARMAIELQPDQVEGYQYLGNAQLHLEQYTDAVLTWERAIELDSGRRVFYQSYSSALANVGRYEEAISATDRALEFDPEQPRLWKNRGQFNESLDRYEAAAADYTRTIELCEQLRDKQADTSPARSEIEYMRTLPLQDLAALARSGRIRAYLALGWAEEARADIGYLIGQGDETHAAAGYLLLGKQHQAAGRREEAISAYAASLDRQPEDARTRLLRADLLLAEDRVDDAIADLMIVAENTQSPDEAVQRLNAILELHPGHAAALKWRAYAFKEQFQPRLAVADLEAALQLSPEDPDLYLWRGLALLMTDVADEEWNKQMTLGRIAQACDDLAMAVKLCPDNAEALAAYRWVADRVSAESWLLGRLERPPHGYGLLQILPSVQEALDRYARSFVLGDERRWREAVEELQAAQSGFLQQEMPVSAMRLDLYLADNYLRLDEFQHALQHITRAEHIHVLIFQPLTKALKTQAEEYARKRWLQGGGRTATPELEYISISGLGMNSFWRDVTLIKAEILGRMGDSDQALRELQAVKGGLDTMVDDLVEEQNIGRLLHIIPVLRDAGETERALGLAERLESIVSDEEERQNLANATSLLYQFRGEFERALHHLEKAHRLALAKDNAYVVTRIEINLASHLIHLERHAEALTYLQGAAKRPNVLSSREQYLYNALLTQAFSGMERYKEAQEAVQRALSIADGLRSTLTLAESRMTWQETLQSAYTLGINVALKNGDVVGCFELVEKARARAFVDELATGRLPLPESASELVTVRDALLAREELLEELLESLEQYGPSYVNYEVVGRLHAQDEGLNVLVQDEDGAEMLSASSIQDELKKVERNLGEVERRLDLERLSTSRATVGATLSVGEVRELLR